MCLVYTNMCAFYVCIFMCLLYVCILCLWTCAHLMYIYVSCAYKHVCLLSMYRYVSCAYEHVHILCMYKYVSCVYELCADALRIYRRVWGWRWSHRCLWAPDVRFSGREANALNFWVTTHRLYFLQKRENFASLPSPFAGECTSCKALQQKQDNLCHAVLWQPPKTGHPAATPVLPSSPDPTCPHPH